MKKREQIPKVLLEMYVLLVIIIVLDIVAISVFIVFQNKIALTSLLALSPLAIFLNNLIENEIKGNPKYLQKSLIKKK